MIAFITGCNGQDGSYLIELLLSKGYKVYGMVRRSSSFNRSRIEHLYNYEDKGQLILRYGDMTDIASIVSILREAQPDEIYNLAAQSHVAVSFSNPLYTGQVDAIGTLNLLEAVRILGLKSKIYQASTSELFSGDEEIQNENTQFNPRSPYGVAKLYAYNICKIYRESYSMFIANGILFNHESERRGENFVTRKITLGIAEILKGKKDFITLGDISTSRDWGYAKDYVEAMWLMLQQEKPDDYVVATGETHTIREFVEEAFKIAKLDIEKHLKQDKKFFRPNEVKHLKGDSSKIRKLGWKPKTSFKELVVLMLKNDTSI